jgi:hypothetical protein
MSHHEESASVTDTSFDSSRHSGPEQPSVPLFTVTIERLGDEIFRFACQLTGNRTDAEDLYQETLIKAFRAFDRLPDEGNSMPEPCWTKLRSSSTACRRSNVWR